MAIFKKIAGLSWGIFLHASLLLAPEPGVAQDEAGQGMSFTSVSQDLELKPLAGLVAPLGQLARYAKSATYFGIGLGKNFAIDADKAVRVAMDASGPLSFTPKSSKQQGDLHLRMFELRADYVITWESWRPFAGLGLGLYKWSADIRRTADQLENNGGGTDHGGMVVFGVERFINDNFALGCETNYRKIAGELNESFAAVAVTVNWRMDGGN